MSSTTQQANKPSESEQLGTLYKFPPELRLTIWELVVNTEQGGEVNFHEPCRHCYPLPSLSRKINNETKKVIEDAGGSGCKHIVFRVVLPSFQEMARSTNHMKLMSAIVERDGQAAKGQGHDITRADTIIFQTSHLGDDAPDTIICYLERDGPTYSYEILGGSLARYQFVEEELLQTLPRVKRALELNVPIVVTAGSEEDEGEDAAACANKIKRDAMTYLAEHVRVSVCEEIDEDEELPEPRLLGP